MELPAASTLGLYSAFLAASAMVFRSSLQSRFTVATMFCSCGTMPEGCLLRSIAAKSWEPVLGPAAIAAAVNLFVAPLPARNPIPNALLQGLLPTCFCPQPPVLYLWTYMACYATLMWIGKALNQWRGEALQALRTSSARTAGLRGLAALPWRDAAGGQQLAGTVKYVLRVCRWH